MIAQNKISEKGAFAPNKEKAALGFLEDKTVSPAVSTIESDKNPAVRERRTKGAEENKKEKKKIFTPFKVKDVVFLAILSVVTLVTCSVMPLTSSLPVFGIAQLVTSLQISVFFAIGLSKVRKTGALFLMALLTGVIQLLLAPPMFFSNILIGLLLEAFILLVFRGFKSNLAVFSAVVLYNPLSLPFNYLYNLAIGKEAVTAIASNAPLAAVGMTAAVVALSAVGALIGLKIAKELKKTGALKK